MEGAYTYENYKHLKIIELEFFYVYSSLPNFS